KHDSANRRPATSHAAVGSNGRKRISGSSSASSSWRFLGVVASAGMADRRPALDRGLLQQPGLLVELLRARMQRDRDAVERMRFDDRLALGVTGVERGAGLVAPHRLGD